MELKCSRPSAGAAVMSSFNRTFMELKYSDYSFETIDLGVLIVPLWN